jgi:cytosine/adenosine deaminase-related metal-dependent hydrolase
VSDRFEHRTKATLLHNARIWTGENNGTEVIHGDVFLDKGIIQGVGNLNLSAFVNGMMARGELNVVDVHGAWVTPGCVGLALGPLQSSSY